MNDSQQDMIQFDNSAVQVSVTCQFPFSSCFALIWFFLFLFPVISLLVNHRLVFSPVFH